MTDAPAWLPTLILLSNHNNEWQKYIDYVFSVFYRDFIQSQPRHAGQMVTCRKDPMCDGKEAGFWHCVSSGPDEDNRTPDIKRCERVAWIRAVIDYAGDAIVSVWKTKKKSDVRVYFWFNEEYLVVLGQRKRYLQLITAFCTDRSHTRRRLRQEYSRAIK